MQASTPAATPPPTQRVPEPVDGAERKLLIGWLSFHRAELEASCAGLTNEELTLRSVMPSAFSLHGLVRHLTEMEHHYFVHAIIGPGEPSWLYRADDEPEAAIELLHPGEAQTSLARWREERQRADDLLLKGKLTDKGPGNGKSLRWNLLKVIGEYARHNGHADLVRQRIGGGADFDLSRRTVLR